MMFTSSDRADAPIVLVDLDGTLCDVRPIRHFVQGRKRDFDAFHLASASCPPNRPVVELVERFRSVGHRIVVVTARHARWTDLTARWLGANAIAYDGLVTRADDDYRPDRDVKAEILCRVRAEHRVVAAVDDRPEVLRLWHAEGLAVVIVTGWFDDTDPAAPVRLLYAGPEEILPGPYGADTR